MRYIIALLAQEPDPFIQEAQRQFSDIAQGYLLSNSSLPHITLAQFDLDDEQKLEEVWRELFACVKDIPQPRFTGIGFSKKAQGLWGTSLSVAREPELVNLHLMVIDVLKNHGIRSITHSKELYRPHVTLARVAEPKLSQFNDSILDPALFILALGQGDENGQYLNTVFQKDKMFT